MKFAIGQLAAVASAVQDSRVLKMATVSDLHLMPMFDPYRSSDGYCWPGSGSQVLDTPAFFGQFGCDPPTETVTLLFSKLSSEHPDLDVIFLTGDYVAHAIPFEPPPEKSYDTASYEEVLSINEQVSQLMA